MTVEGCLQPVGSTRGSPACPPQGEVGSCRHRRLTSDAAGHESARGRHNWSGFKSAKWEGTASVCRVSFGADPSVLKLTMVLIV